MALVTVQNNETSTIVQNNKTPMTEAVPDANTAHAQEIAILKEDMAGQEALRTRERELKKLRRKNKGRQPIASGEQKRV